MDKSLKYEHVHYAWHWANSQLCTTRQEVGDELPMINMAPSLELYSLGIVVMLRYYQTPFRRLNRLYARHTATSHWIRSSRTDRFLLGVRTRTDTSQRPNGPVQPAFGLKQTLQLNCLPFQTFYLLLELSDAVLDIGNSVC